jgi:hypothetical protein
MVETPFYTRYKITRHPLTNKCPAFFPNNFDGKPRGASPRFTMAPEDYAKNPITLGVVVGGCKGLSFRDLGQATDHYAIRMGNQVGHGTVVLAYARKSTFPSKT